MKRRELLKAGVAAGAGMFLVPRLAAARKGDEADELNVALIGVGLQGRALINAAVLMSNVRFRAVCDVWEYARRYGQYYLKNYGHEVNTYADYREMLAKEKDLDAVVVASPDFVHAEQTNACLEAGCHVYCETMMSNTLQGARSMVRTARKTGKLLQIGYQRRSNPRYLHCYHKLLGEAKLTGRTTQLNAQWVYALNDDRGWPRKYLILDDALRRSGYGSMHEFRNWRWFRKYSGGLFGNLGGQQIDVANWFLGVTPRSVLAVGSENHNPTSQWHKNVMAICEYETPAGLVQAFCQMLTATRGDGSMAYEHFLGTKGSLKVSQTPKWTGVYRDPDAPEWDKWVNLDYLKKTESRRLSRSEREAREAMETGEVETFQLPMVLDKPVHYPHLENFLGAVRGKAKLTCPADEAYRTQVVALKINEAIAAKKLVTFTAEDFAV